MANVLQVRDGGGRWENQATRRGVDATGWSWSARFGDLDQDGYLDLYVVNGMIATDLFGHLANGELVEENQAFRNRGDGSFQPAPEWQLGSTASGRGMLMADLDDDGDLDIVVNNLRGFAQLFENQLCTAPACRSTCSGLAPRIAARSAPNWRSTPTWASCAGMSAPRAAISPENPLRVHFGFPASNEIAGTRYHLAGWSDFYHRVAAGWRPLDCD